MDGNQLRSFLAIAGLGSITRAAEQLGIAQPTLSQMLLKLEDELAIKLFVRMSRGVVLTEGGRVFHEHARNILKEMERACDEARQPDALARSIVAVGLPSSISILLGARLVMETRAQLSAVSLQLAEAMSGHIRAWVEDGRLDIGILHDIGALRHLSVRQLFLEELYLVGPAGRLGPTDERGIAQGRMSLLGSKIAPFILPTRQHGLRQFVDRQFQGEGVDLPVEIEVDSLNHIKELVSAGQGYSILSHAAIQRELLDGRLAAARTERPVFRRTIYLVRNPARVVTRAALRVEDLMVSLMQSLIAEGIWLAEPLTPGLSSRHP